MATASFKGHISFQDLSSGVLSSADAISAANNASWDRLFFTSVNVTKTRETDDITENVVAREMAEVLFTWSATVDFTLKRSSQGGYAAQQLLDQFLDNEDDDMKLYVRLVGDPSGTNRVPANGDRVEWGQVIVTGFTENREVSGVVRVSVSLQGTGPLTRTTMTA